jgi:hypothetical protein
MAKLMDYLGSMKCLLLALKRSKEAQIYSVLSFPQKREPSKISKLDSCFRGDDE